jgi:hypothetical protein
LESLYPNIFLVQNDKVRVAAAPHFQIVAAASHVQIDISGYALRIVKK